jgi:hypothetical protein
MEVVCTFETMVATFRIASCHNPWEPHKQYYTDQYPKSLSTHCPVRGRYPCQVSQFRCVTMAAQPQHSC